MSARGVKVLHKPRRRSRAGPITSRCSPTGWRSAVLLRSLFPALIACLAGVVTSSSARVLDHLRYRFGPVVAGNGTNENRSRFFGFSTGLREPEPW
jgi:hypothetical protein